MIFHILLGGFILLLLMLYETNKTFRYYAKMTVYYFNLNFVCIAPVFTGIFYYGKTTKNQRMVAMYMKHVKKLFGIEMEVRGEDNLKSAQPCIIVCNHQSSVDLMGMMEIWPDDCTVLAKKELMYTGIFGVALYYSDILFVDRKRTGKAVNYMQNVAEEVKKQKLSVFIFPEGTRNRNGTLLPFKKGAFHLAVEAGVPILPIVFSSLSAFYSRDEKRFDSGKMIISCLPKISTEGLTADDIPELTEKTRQQMLDVFNSTSLETTDSKYLCNGLKSQ